MPRKSSSSSDVLQITRPIQPPAPPSDLTAGQQAQFIKFANALPVDYFTAAMISVLAELCRQIDYSNQAAMWLDAHPIDGLRTPADFRDHRHMARRHLTASDRVVRLSTKLRFLPQNQYHAVNTASRSGKTGTRVLAGVRRPWDRRRGDDDGDGVA